MWSLIVSYALINTNRSQICPPFLTNSLDHFIYQYWLLVPLNFLLQPISFTISKMSLSFKKLYISSEIFPSSNFHINRKQETGPSVTVGSNPFRCHMYIWRNPVFTFDRRLEEHWPFSYSRYRRGHSE